MWKVRSRKWHNFMSLKVSPWNHWTSSMYIHHSLHKNSPTNKTTTHHRSLALATPTRPVILTFSASCAPVLPSSQASVPTSPTRRRPQAKADCRASWWGAETFCVRIWSWNSNKPPISRCDPHHSSGGKLVHFLGLLLIVESWKMIMYDYVFFEGESEDNHHAIGARKRW